MHTAPVDLLQTPSLLSHTQPSLTWKTRTLMSEFHSSITAQPFNTVIPHKLNLGLNPALCEWLQDCLTGRLQSVKTGNLTSNSVLTHTCTPQGCVLSPVLYTLFTLNCVASHKDNIILKYADDTTVVSLITGGDETAYRSEVVSLVTWCDNHNLSLNIDKTKEIILDMMKKRTLHQPLSIQRSRWRGPAASNS